jgi:hypothetical protein
VVIRRLVRHSWAGTNWKRSAEGENCVGIDCAIASSRKKTKMKVSKVKLLESALRRGIRKRVVRDMTTESKGEVCRTTDLVWQSLHGGERAGRAEKRRRELDYRLSGRLS